ncbi:MAG: hypothetical protein IPK24_22750 [Kineosporiaceae bacterium]|nr:hypothetical protein [Kineosporiaceae bacterium]
MSTHRRSTHPPLARRRRLAARRPRYRRALQDRRTSSMQDVEDFAALVANSLTDVRSTAEKWRTGLAALITLVSTAWDQGTRECT